MFKAIYLTKSDQFRAELRDLDDTELEANTPEADTTVEIDYSTINYKDGLALTNKSPIVRKWPMVPGIDCAGSVQAGTSSHVRAGDKVVLNGWGAGETLWGGLAQRGRYKSEHLVRIPAPLMTRDAMSIGTPRLLRGSHLGAARTPRSGQYRQTDRGRLSTKVGCV